jgi:hypothetical protein
VNATGTFSVLLNHPLDLQKKDNNILSEKDPPPALLPVTIFSSKPLPVVSPSPLNLYSPANSLPAALAGSALPAHLSPRTSQSMPPPPPPPPKANPAPPLPLPTTKLDPSPKRMFHLVQQPSEKQRKSYKKENR